LAFRRTHDPTVPKSAEESLVDTIASEFSFYPQLLKPLVTVIPNFRVPNESVIHKVFYDQLPYAEAEENLALWVSSGGKRLPNRRVRVKAKRINDAIHALIIAI
jgi:hypothetical protein